MIKGGPKRVKFVGGIPSAVGDSLGSSISSTLPWQPVYWTFSDVFNDEGNNCNGALPFVPSNFLSLVLRMKEIKQPTTSWLQLTYRFLYTRWAFPTWNFCSHSFGLEATFATFNEPNKIFSWKHRLFVSLLKLVNVFPKLCNLFHRENVCARNKMFYNNQN